MRIGELHRALNRYVAHPVLVVFLFAFCVSCHKLALWQMGLCNRNFIVMDTETVHNMALIDFVGNNYPLAIIYLVFFEGLLLFLAIRGCPRWSIWITFLVLSMPCLMYMYVCAFISGKMIF